MACEVVRRPAREIGGAEIRCVELGSGDLGDAVDAPGTGGRRIPARRPGKVSRAMNSGSSAEARRETQSAMPLDVSSLTKSRREVLTMPTFWNRLSDVCAGASRACTIVSAPRRFGTKRFGTWPKNCAPRNCRARNDHSASGGERQNIAETMRLNMKMSSITPRKCVLRHACVAIMIFASFDIFLECIVLNGGGANLIRWRCLRS